MSHTGVVRDHPPLPCLVHCHWNLVCTAGQKTDRVRIKMTEKEAYILKGFKGFVKLVHEGGSTCLLSAVKICGHQDGVRCDQLEQATIVIN